MTDLTVLGGGIFGLSIAWEALRRGAHVQLIERDRIGAGSSGGLVGALAPHVPEGWNDKKAFQRDSLLMAAAFWAEVEAISGAPSGYGRLGRLQPIDDADGLALAQTRAVGAATLWEGAAHWQIVPQSDHAGWMPETGTGQAILDTLSARLHPAQACAALAEAFQKAGGRLILGQGTPAGVVIEATGAAGLAALSDGSARAMGTGIKGQAALLAFDARDKPQLFVGGLHIVPHADGTTAIGSTTENSYDAAQTTDAQLERLIETARQRIPALRQAPVLARWAGLRPRSRSRAPMLGRHPFAPDRFIANGGFKIGFGMAPKVAQVMVDLVLEGRDAIPDSFRPEASL